MKTRPFIILIGLTGILSAAAWAEDSQPKTPDKLIVFSLTSDEANAENIEVINAEVHMVLSGTGNYQIVSADDLSEEMMMDPSESLAFCNEEPGCIAGLGTNQKARWILYGNVKASFDKSLVLVQLTLIDVPANKIHKQKFGQIPAEANVVEECGNVLRDLLGLRAPEPKPKPKPVVVKEEVADLPAGHQQPLPATIVRTRPQAEAKSPWSNPWTLTAAGVGVAAAGAGLALGLLSDRKVNDAKSPGYDQPTAYGMLQDAEDMALGANILFGVGGAALATATVLFILDATGDATGDRPPAHASVACTPSGCTAVLSARF